MAILRLRDGLQAAIAAGLAGAGGLGNSDAARHAWAVLKLLVERLPQAWPSVGGVRIMFWGDWGFCRWCAIAGLRWCE